MTQLDKNKKMAGTIKKAPFFGGLVAALVISLTACSQYISPNTPTPPSKQENQPQSTRISGQTLAFPSQNSTEEILAHLWLEGEIAFASTNQVGLLAIPGEAKPQVLADIQATETGQYPVFLTANQAGNRLGWVSNETEIMTWRINSSDSPHQVAEPDLPVTSIALSPGGDELAYASLDGNIVRQPLMPGAQALAEWPAPHWLANLAYSPDGKQIGGADLSSFKVYIFKLDGALVSTLEWTGSISAALYGVYFSPDWRTLAWVGGNSVQLMELTTGQTTYLLNHEDAVSNAVWSPNSKWIATASVANNAGNLTPVVDIWNCSDGELAASFPLESAVQSLSFSPGGNEISVLDTNAVIHIFALP